MKEFSLLLIWERTTLRKRNFPYPCLTTLRDRLQGLKFEPGVLEEVFELLAIKVSQFSNPLNKHCILFLDEMAITPGTFFDPSTKQIFGLANIPTTTGGECLATHILVFMLGGIGAKWKQVVAFYFTGSSVDGRLFKPIVIDIIKRAENIGLFVHGITSDMGSMNQALWSVFSINASRYSQIINSAIHPCNKSREIFFFHDAPHGLKNLKQGILNNGIIILPSKFVEENDLPTSMVKACHLSELCQVNEKMNFSLSLAPKLKPNMIERKGHFNKMKVKNSIHVISPAVAAALNFYGESTQTNEFLTTAYFISKMAKWFKLMTSRNLKLSLSKHKPEKLVEAINFLREIMELVRDMKVGENHKWKPFQTGILISTKSVIDLSSYLMNNEGFEFIFTGRFSQDCLENLFSVLRSKHVIPNAVQAKGDLKLISVAQYMKNVTNSSYDEDDRHFFCEFSDRISEKQKADRKSAKENEERYLNTENIPIGNIEVTFNFYDLNCLYYIGGYVISSIKKKSNVFTTCVSAAGSMEKTDFAYASLTRHKCFGDNTLFFINDDTFKFIRTMEIMFCTYYEAVWKLEIDLNKFFMSKMFMINFSLPDCHKLHEKIIKKFVSFRIKSVWNK